MTKKAKKASKSNDSDKMITFVTGPGIASGTAVGHSGAVNHVKKSLSQVSKDFEHILADCAKILQGAEQAAAKELKEFHLDEISIGLAFDASGKLSFIAGVEAGIEASIEIKFTRKPS